MLNCKLISLIDSTKSCAYFTPFSFIHFLSGMSLNLGIRFLFPKLRYKFYLSLAIHTIYECKDMTYTYILKKRDYHKDNTFANCIGDTISFIFGYYIANKLNYNKKVFGSCLVAYILFAIIFYYFKLG